MRQGQRLLWFALALVVAQVAVAVFAGGVAPYDPVAQDIIARMKGPSAAHWLGTDQFGRDVLSRIIHGSRTSLLVSAAAVLAALALGGTLGLVAAFYRGWTDRLVMRAMDVLFAFPVMLLAIGVVAVLGPRTETRRLPLPSSTRRSSRGCCAGRRWWCARATM